MGPGVLWTATKSRWQFLYRQVWGCFIQPRAPTARSCLSASARCCCRAKAARNSSNSQRAVALGA
eukprot:9121702-Lingulodinium_polyedra.AAC.1